VSNIDVKTQSLVRKNGDPYISVWVSLDRIESKVSIEHPKLGEILS